MGRVLLAGLIALFSAFAAAQSFPERPVRIIVPLTPGGSPDTIARSIAAPYSSWLTAPTHGPRHFLISCRMQPGVRGKIWKSSG